MTAIRWLETDTLSNQNIATALAIGAYTAAADRVIMAQAFADQVAGNGDYVMYATLQVAGAGSHYVILPKTTMAAASGETAIAGQSGWINVRNGDVVTVYIDGLAGDTTTPDTIVRWFEDAALQPTTADRTLDVDANMDVTLSTTQPAITWGQQKIVANAAMEGALDIRNSNALGIGLYDSGDYAGQYNVSSSIGMLNIGTGVSSYGNLNQGIVIGQTNYGAGASGVGQDNQGTVEGQYNHGASGQVNVGTGGDGIYANGTDYGIQAVGVTGDIDPDFSALLTGVNVSSIANGAITAASIATAAIDADAIAADAIGSSELAASAVNEIADQVWDELIAGHAIAGSTGATLSTAASAGGATPASLWAYASRTLTQSAAQVADIVSGSSITAQRGDTLSAALTGLGAITGYTSLDFTVKQNKSDADTAAIIRIRKNASGVSDGLIRLNGAAATTAADGSITIDDAALGNITIALIAADTDDLIPGQGYYYDVQKITGATVLTMTTGTFNVAADVTRLVA